ncbi:Pectin lyase-like superfamily protein [Striga hermonthica]|uniref:Pectin lyase-like superfamily protein n=1 Tax=Striga hermonthica TaxID=68872 RepID=A0A9N7RN48_STRHE|nr:Pectin lyase-like superfamily protein [Striga hermonthica]
MDLSPPRNHPATSREADAERRPDIPAQDTTESTGSVSVTSPKKKRLRPTKMSFSGGIGPSSESTQGDAKWPPENEAAFVSVLLNEVLMGNRVTVPIALAAYSKIPTYNVLSFGASRYGLSDYKGAFLQAWKRACADVGPAVIHVPEGRYPLGAVSFEGRSCKSTAIAIRIEGTLVAPSNYEALGNRETWLRFVGVDGVSIFGGTLDGQGKRLWACKHSGNSCPHGAMSLTFNNSKNIYINGLTSYNPQFFHILVEGCHNVKLTNVNIQAPARSPNTDGIHVNMSTGVTITNSNIGTGDDCISIGPGTSNLWIEKVTCGPGHGISIGSLGWTPQEPGVRDVTVKSVLLTGTQNGVRIKTWARDTTSYVHRVLFQHIHMQNVGNPIFIDQNYCPNHMNCPTEESGVRISDVTYEDIRGTSASLVAVNLGCSGKNPCDRITLRKVYLTYRKNKQATASCGNARGIEEGNVNPAGCF